MGAWGERAFQNDSALDWLAELETGGVATLRKTLSAVGKTHLDDYLDVDDGASAVAAAEIVAAGFELRDVGTPAVRRWLEANRGALIQADRELARRAVVRVLERQSELRELWEENGPDNAWTADVRSLLEKLGGNDGLNKLRLIVGEGARPSFKHEKQAIFTFLSARGLQPNPKQAARIEASVDREEIHKWLARAMSVAKIADLFDE